LREALACFEITHRGYLESAEAIRQALQFGLVLGHELRAPLTSVKASAGMLREHLADRSDRVDGTAVKLVENIQAGAASLQQRVDELVDLVGLHSGTLTVSPAPVEPAPLLRTICRRLEPEVSAAGMTFGVDIPSDLPVLRLDAARVEQVVRNLVQNAVKYAREGKAVNVTAAANGNHVEISVRDYGPGISAWDRTKIFQPFVRAGRNRATTHGLGVGLALCQAIVYAHGGRISLVSDEGAGTVITVSLPVISSVKRTEEAHESPDR
jgi:signal transduction histidine kinase